MASPTAVVTPAYPYLELEFTIGVFRSSTIPARITLLGEEYLVGRGIVDHQPGMTNGVREVLLISNRS